MPDVFIDFETRSLADLPKIGAWKYAAHESTYPLMLAVVFLDGDRRLQWLEYKHGRDCPDWVADFALDPEMRVHAHNANFEIAIWRKVCVERWGWPDISTERWRDTAGKATHANLPRALAYVAKTIKAKVKKDPSGMTLIKQLSMPRKSVAAKTDIEGDPRLDNRDYLKKRGVEFFDRDDDNGAIWYWEDDAKLFRKFAKYNEVDVLAEIEVDSLIPSYSGREQEVWVLDSIINERGLPIDRQLCEAAIELFEHEADRAEVGIQNLTDGAVTKPTQGKRMLKWIAERDPRFGPSMAKEAVAGWLARQMTVRSKSVSEIRKLLYFRDILGGAAIKKFQAALLCSDDDDRARGQLLYYGASTGRWAGKGIQIHNFFRAGIPDEDVFDLIKTADHAEVRAYCKANDLNVTDLLKRCVRGLICAPDGKTLIVSDFAGIESRVLQWLAGNQEVLQLFRDGADLYVHTAANIFGLDYADMMGRDGVLKEHKDKRQIGKICVLALGYGMGWMKYLATCEMMGGVTLTNTDAQDIVKQWRESNPLVCQLWKRVEKAFKAVIRNRKIIARVFNRQGFGVRIGYDDRDFIWVELPGGRKLYYYQARLVEDPREDWGPKIVYRDGGKGEVDTYGGKLVENIVQAISRDLLVNSMFIAEDKGLSTIGHVHDEIIVEHDEDAVELGYEELHEAMTTCPEWAAGLPLAAETYISKRYTK